MRNRPSQTALSVALNILALSSDPVYGKVVPAEAVAPTRWFLEAASGPSKRFSQWIRSPIFRAYLRWAERRTLPGISIHNAVRKRWIEAKVRQFIDAGCSQVVVLGAGFDTLAYRLQQVFPQVHFWEFDHPATQQVKHQALVLHGGVPGNLTLVPVDFSKRSLPKVLESIRDYNIREMAVFVAEGLLMYLREKEVRQLLQAIRTHSGRGSSLIGTALEPDQGGRLAVPGASALVNLRLRLVGEPFRWGISPERLPQFLESNQFRVVEVTRVRELLPKYLPDKLHKIHLPGGEYLFLALRGE